MEQMLGDYVRDEVSMIMHLLAFGLRKIPKAEDNCDERMFMRAVLTLLEMLDRNVSKQMELQERRA